MRPRARDTPDLQLFAFLESWLLNLFQSVRRLMRADALHDAAGRGESASAQLLITDVMMPGTTGIDLAIRFREINPKCKVLLFSAKAATADLLEIARKQGYEFEVLAKPVHPEDLLAKPQADRQEVPSTAPHLRGVIAPTLIPIRMVNFH